MGKEIKIEKKIKWDGEHKKWMAILRVGLEARLAKITVHTFAEDRDNDWELLEIFRDKDKELFGQKLTADWGSLYKDEEGNYYRVVDYIESFDEYQDALSFLINYETEALRIISEVTIYNAERKKKEFSEVDYYTLTKDGEVRRV